MQSFGTDLNSLLNADAYPKFSRPSGQDQSHRHNQDACLPKSLQPFLRGEIRILFLNQDAHPIEGVAGPYLEGPPDPATILISEARSPPATLHLAQTLQVDSLASSLRFTLLDR